MMKRRILGLLLMAVAAGCTGDELLGPATLEGVVRSLATTQRLDGATVRFGKRATTTAHGGEFVLTGLPTGDVDVVVSLDGYEAVTHRVTLGSGTNTTNILIPPKGSGQYIDAIELQPPASPVVMTGPGSIRIGTRVYFGSYGPGLGDTATIAISTTGPVTAKWELAGRSWRALQITVSEPGTGTVTVSYKDKSASVAITALDPRFKRIAYSSGYGCGLAVDDTVWCWGGNFNGALGYPTLGKCNGSFCQYGGNDGNPSPLPVSGGYKFAQIATTGYGCADGFAFGICGRTCALTAAGEAWCWGEGMGPAPRRVATTVTLNSLTLHPARFPAAVESCGLTPAGKAYCFTATATTPIAADMTFKSFAAGSAHACGIDLSGDAYCWGSNRQANLGIGTADTSAHPSPVKVLTSATFTAIAVGGSSTCALETTGTVSCWGFTGSQTNDLCDASNTSCVMLPQSVASGQTYTAIAHADGPEICALTGVGGVDCWSNPTLAPAQPFPEPMVSIGVGSPNVVSPLGPTWCGLATSGVIYCGSPSQPAKRFP